MENTACRGHSPVGDIGIADELIEKRVCVSRESRARRNRRGHNYPVFIQGAHDHRLGVRGLIDFAAEMDT